MPKKRKSQETIAREDRSRRRLRHETSHPTVSASSTHAIVVASEVYRPDPPKPGSLFLYYSDIFGVHTEICCLLLLKFFESNFGDRSRSRRSSSLYPLQGAGGMESAEAISMIPGFKQVPPDVRSRVESAVTVKNRGGMDRFLVPSESVSEVIRFLDSVSVARIKLYAFFGIKWGGQEDLALGFCEFVHLAEGQVISEHRDGGNDCDVCAIVCFKNDALCTVNGEKFLLKEGDAYIFEPQKFSHSVSAPIRPGPRIIIALRFFRVKSINN